MNKFIGYIDGIKRHKSLKSKIILEYSKSDEQIILKISYRERTLKDFHRTDKFLNNMFLELRKFLLEHNIKEKEFITSIKSETNKG